MSIAIMSAVWTIKLPDSEKLVLLALADAANDEGVCWPSMASLVAKCSKSDRTIQASIKSLVTAGHLKREERVGRGVVYTVSPRKDFAPEETSPPKGTTPTPEAASDKPSRTIISQKTSSSSKARASAKPAFELPDWIPADPWNGWLEMRIAKGKRPTNRALNLAVTELRKLADAGHPPGDVLDQSTLNQWSGLFHLKDKSHERSGSSSSHGAARGAARGSPADAYLSAHDRVDFARQSLF